MNCPHCLKDIPDVDIAKHLASKGGRKSKRTLTPEQSKEMNEKRWGKKKEEKDGTGNK